GGYRIRARSARGPRLEHHHPERPEGGMKHDPEFIRAVVASYGKQPKSVVAKRHGITPNTVSGIWHRHVPADVKAALQANLRRHRRASVKKAIAAHPVKWNSTRHGGAEMKVDAPELAVT